MRKNTLKAIFATTRTVLRNGPRGWFMFRLIGETYRSHRDERNRLQAIFDHLDTIIYDDENERMKALETAINDYEQDLINRITSDLRAKGVSPSLINGAFGTDLATGLDVR